MQNKPKLVLGIDPGYDRIGIALVTQKDRKETVVHSCCIETNRKETFTQRLYFLATELETIITTWKPDFVAIETLYFKQNKTTAIKVAEARGAMLYIATKHSVPIKEFNPGTIKSTVTGNGRAQKAEMIKMVQLTTGITTAKHDDEYDAIATAITGILTERLAVPQPSDR